MVLPKPNRLKQQQDFSAVYQAGARYSSRHLILHALLLPTMDSVVLPIRVGLSISQKVSKRAVVRNRIRRQLRAACRDLLNQLLPGCSVVIVVRPEAVQCDYQQFLQELKQLFTEAKILHGY